MVPFLLAAILMTGCKDEVITEYDAPREEQDRTLVAMFPRGPQTCWFFLLTGPAREVRKQKDAFDRFVHSVRFVDGKPTWTVPDGWTREPNSGDRFAVLNAGDPAAPLEVTITKLEGPMVCDILLNVNRWRFQLGLGELTESELDQFAKEEKIDDQSVTLVDLTGRGGVRTKKAADPAKEPPITFDVPGGWEKVANPAGGAPGVQRFATYEVRKDGKSAEVNIQMLGGDGGGDLSNIARWRGQVKLPDANAEELNRHVQKGFKLAGEEALYAKISGERPSAESILAVLARRGKIAWTIKMKGPKELVEDQQENFDRFLNSIRFSGK
jgi:hypothetical protein